MKEHVMTIVLLITIGVLVGTLIAVVVRQRKRDQEKSIVNTPPTPSKTAYEWLEEIKEKSYLGYICIGGGIYLVDNIYVVPKNSYYEGPVHSTPTVRYELRIGRSDTEADYFDATLERVEESGVERPTLEQIMLHLLYAQYSYRGWQLDKIADRLDEPYRVEVFGDIDVNDIELLYSTVNERRIFLVPARYGDNGWVLEGRSGPVGVLELNGTQVEWIIPRATDVIITYGEFIRGLLDGVKQIVDAYYDVPGYVLNRERILKITPGRKSRYFEMVAKFVEEYHMKKEGMSCNL